MIYLPNSNIAGRVEVIEDYDRLADWVELACLFSDSSEVSFEDICETIHSAGLVEIDPEDEEDPISLICENIFRKLTFRSNSLACSYPFQVEKEMIVRRSIWEENLCFTALLLADMLRFYEFEREFIKYSKVKFTYNFEKIVEACASSICHSKSVRFGWPRDKHLGWPTDIADRVNFMSEKLDLKSKGWDRTQSKDKDIGLDVVARWRLSDDFPGQLILLIQCATGDNWKGKKGEPSLATWSNIVDWKARVVRGIAFPWRIDIGANALARISDEFEALILDRFRLLAGGNPDCHFDELTRERIHCWCSELKEQLLVATADNAAA